MKRVAWVFAPVLCAAFLFSSASSQPGSQPAPEPRDISGRYFSIGDSTKAVGIKAMAPDVYRTMADGWEGVGFFDGTIYWGVFRSLQPAQRHGTHRGTLNPDGSLAVHGEFTDGGGKAFDVVWAPFRTSGSRPQPGRVKPPPPEPKIVVTPPGEDELPKLGDYVYVEELPEAITKVPPVYPDAARAAKVEGTVLVQALVGKDGRIADTKIVKSIPELDDAAAASVRQWVFKPALTAGKPVAVWVAVPVRFSLN